MISAEMFSTKIRDKVLTRSVSSVEFGLNGEGSFDKAIALSVKWTRGLNPAVPREASSGLEFEVGGGGEHPARAVNLSYEGGRIWSSTIDNPDRNVLGRTWVTEITVAEQNGEARLGTRLLSVTRRNDELYVPSVPRIVRDVISRAVCTSGGVRLFSSPTFINNSIEIEWLTTLLGNPVRELPVIIMAEATTRNAVLNLAELAKRLTGAAHVVGVSARQTEEFRRYTGRDFAVFDGAVRLFRPAFNPEEDDPYSHPLWFPTGEKSNQDAMASIISRVLASSVSKGTTDYPRFQAVRQLAAAQILSARRNSSDDKEMLRLYEDENETLKNQLQGLRDEQNQWLADAEVVRARLERELAEVKADIYRYKIQNENLALTISNSGATIEKTPLRDLSELRDWSAISAGERVWIAPKAIKEAEKNGIYRDPKEIGDAILLLSNYYVQMKIHPEKISYAQLQEVLEKSGLQLSNCFAQANDIKQFPSYSVMYKGEKLWCDLHLKRGGGTDPRSMFRIYFTWHEGSETLVIGHLPTHLDNNLTN